MMNVRLCAAFTALLAVTAGCDMFVSANTRMERAQSAISNNDYGRAIVELRNVLQSKPGDLHARTKLVEALVLNNELPAVEAELPKLASAGSNDAAAQAVLARVFIAKRDYQGLLDALDKHQLHFDPTTEQVRRAQALLGLRKEAEASALVKQVISAQPNNAEAHLLYAQSLAAQGAGGEAITALDELLKIAPQDARAWAAKGYLHAQQGAALQAAQALANANHNAGGQLTRIEELSTLTLLVEQQLAIGNIKAAQNSEKQLSGFFPNSPIAMLAKGEVMFAQANYPEVVSQMQSLLVKQSDLYAARLLLARALATQGNERQAESELQKIVSAVPQNVAARITLAQVQMNLAEPVQAVQALVPVAIAANTPQVAALLSEAQNAIAGSEKELTDLQDVLRREPGNEPLRIVTASVLLHAGRAQPALDLLRDVRTGALNARRVPLLLKAISMQSNPGAARGEAERIAAEHAHDPEYLAAIASYFSAQKDFATASAWFERALNATRESDDTKRNELPLLRQLLTMQLAAGKKSEALHELQTYRNAHPDDINGLILEADLQTELRDFNAALVASSSAFQVAPNSRTVLKLANAKRLTGSSTPYEDLTDWLKRNPEDLSVRLALADLYLSMKKQREAIAEYEGVVDFQPTNAMALNNLAWLYQQQGDSRAESTARKAYAANSASPVIADTLGWLLFKAGKAEEAAGILQKAAAKAPSQPDIQYHYAAALSKNGKTQEARERLNALLAKNPSFETRKEAEQSLAQLSAQ